MKTRRTKTKIALLALVAGMALSGGAAADGSGWDWNAPTASVDPTTTIARTRQISIGNADALTDQSNFRFDWSGAGTVPPLSTVEGAATAAGNLLSVDTVNKLDLRAAQVTAGRASGQTGTDEWLSTLGDGRFAVGSVAANATATDVANARVDLSGVAAGNIADLSVAPPSGIKASATVGLNQLSKQDASASASATGTQIDSRLVTAPLDGAISRVGATALGNLTNITVRAPGLGN